MSRIRRIWACPDPGRVAHWAQLPPEVAARVHAVAAGIDTATGIRRKCSTVPPRRTRRHPTRSPGPTRRPVRRHATRSRAPTVLTVS